MALVTQSASSVDAQREQWGDLVPLLDEAMAGLKEVDRTAVLLRYFRGQSMKEVGAALGMEPNTASKRIERAVEKLRAFFARKGVAVGAAALVAGLEANAVNRISSSRVVSTSSTPVSGSSVPKCV